MTEENNLKALVYNTFRHTDTEKFQDYFVDTGLTHTSGSITVIDYLYKIAAFDEKAFCQLIAGHKGSGKTTLLLKLKQKLEEENFIVVYCPMGKVLNIDDFHYVDFLLGMLKFITETLENKEILLNYNALGQVSLTDLKNLIPFKSLSFDLKFSKVIEYMSFSNFIRNKAREIFDQQGLAFFDSLKQILDQAREEIKKRQFKDLIIIMDDIDDYNFTSEKSLLAIGDMFLKYSNNLKFLNTKTLITMPLSFMFSELNTPVQKIWNENIVYIPLLNVLSEDENIRRQTKSYLKQIISRRLQLYELKESDIFLEDALDKIISLSGGNTRQLFNIIQKCCLFSESLPITPETIGKAQIVLREEIIRSIPGLIFDASGDIIDALDCYSESSLLSYDYMLYYPDNKEKISINPLIM